MNGHQVKYVKVMVFFSPQKGITAINMVKQWKSLGPRLGYIHYEYTNKKE